jgi:hypothetical protein
MINYYHNKTHGYLILTDLKTFVDADFLENAHLFRVWESDVLSDIWNTIIQAI